MDDVASAITQSNTRRQEPEGAGELQYPESDQRQPFTMHEPRYLRLSGEASAPPSASQPSSPQKAAAATPSMPSLLSRLGGRKNSTAHGKAKPTVAVTLPPATKNSVVRRGQPSSWPQLQPLNREQSATPSSKDKRADTTKGETTSSPIPATPSTSGGTGGNKRRREESAGSDPVSEKKVRSSSQLNRQPPGSAASSSKDKGNNGSNSMIDYVQRRPLFSRTSRPD